MKYKNSSLKMRGFAENTALAAAAILVPTAAAVYPVYAAPTPGAAVTPSAATAKKAAATKSAAAAPAQFGGGGGFGRGGFGRGGGGGGQFGGGGGGGDATPETPAWNQFKLDTRKRISLDFRNANIDAVLQFISLQSGITIVKDPTLTGGITLQSAKPVSLSDAFAILNANLSLRNFDLTKEGNLLIIRSRGGGGGGRGNNGFNRGAFDPSALIGLQNASAAPALQVYPIKYANASQIARVINDVFAANPQQAGGQNNGGNNFGNNGNNGGNNNGGNNPFAFGRNGGNGGGGRFGRGGGGGAVAPGTVHASSDDYSNSVIVNAPTELQGQVSSLIDQLDRQTDQPQQSRVYPLKYAAAGDIVSVVQNVLISNAPRGRGGIGNSAQQVPIEQRFQAARQGGGQTAFGNVVAESRTNSLIVTATNENLDLVAKVIQQLDKPIAYVDNTFIFTLQNARADVVAQLLNQSFANRSANSGTTNFLGNRTITTVGSVSANGNRITGSTGGGGGGANTGRAEGLHSTRAMGIPGDAAGQASSALAAAAVADPQFGGGFGGGGFGGGGFGGGGFGGGGGGGNRGNQNQRTSTVQSAVDEEGRIVNVRDLSGEVSIIPDVNTNSVVVVTSPQNRVVVESILKQLDRIPSQVMIETLIVEASLQDTEKLGVEWSLGPAKALNDKNATNTTSQSFGLKADLTQPQGLRYTLSGTQYSAFLQAVQTDQKFEVLSTPRIFTSNNATAQINISQSLPYVLSQTTDATTGTVLYNYSFLDVGIVLTVTPRITSNGYVTMDVTQTANDFVGYTSFNAPIVNQREAQTTVSVKDGETVVLGGIIDNTVTKTDNKIPLLGDIPFIGNLFREHTHDKHKTELLVFLTPRVVRDANEAQMLREATEKTLDSRTLDRLMESRKAPGANGTSESADVPTGTAGPSAPAPVAPSSLPSRLPAPPPAPAPAVGASDPGAGPAPSANPSAPTATPGRSTPAPAP